MTIPKLLVLGTGGTIAGAARSATGKSYGAGEVAIESILADIDPKAPFMDRAKLPANGEGMGLVEAARGSLGHWIRIEDGAIASYQIIAPTTWNFSPRDAGGTPGPVEAALVGAPVREGEETPLSVQHIVRSFDPCMVCTVH